MHFQNLLSLLKYIIFPAFFLVVFSNVHAQNARSNNFFADINSIDLDINLSPSTRICGIRDNDIRTAVGFTLSNSPLKRIDLNSTNILSISIAAVNDKTVSGKSLGCSAAINYELWRFVNFKGINNLVTVWSKTAIQVGPEDSISQQVSSHVERTTKEFIAKWAEQN
jgi:hypothetical protein